MGKCKQCKQCKGRLEEDFISDYLTMSVDQRPCALCRGTGVIRTGPYRLADGTWSDGVDRRIEIHDRIPPQNRWQVYQCESGYWEAYAESDGQQLDEIDSFPTHAEAIAYADRMARTNQGGA